MWETMEKNLLQVVADILFCHSDFSAIATLPEDRNQHNCRAEEAVCWTGTSCLHQTCKGLRTRPNCALLLCPRHSKNGGGAFSVTHVRVSVRPSLIKNWCPLNNF